MTSLTIHELKQKLSSNDSNVVFLDCREPDEFAYTHIQGFINIPISEFEKRAAQELNPENNIIVIAHLEGRAERACEFLKEHHFTHVAFVSGGLEKWSLEIDGKIRRY